MHDRLGRLTQLYRAERGDVSAGYEPNGLRRDMVFANGVAAGFAREPSGRLSRLVYEFNGIDEFGQTFTTGILDAAYGYDAAGDITAIDEGPGEVRTFGHDALKRLTRPARRSARRAMATTARACPGRDPGATARPRTCRACMSPGRPAASSRTTASPTATTRSAIC